MSSAENSQGSGVAATLVLDIPAFDATFTTAPASVQFLGQTYASESSIKLSGRLVLKVCCLCSCALA